MGAPTDAPAPLEMEVQLDPERMDEAQVIRGPTIFNESQQAVELRCLLDVSHRQDRDRGRHDPHSIAPVSSVDGLPLGRTRCLRAPRAVQQPQAVGVLRAGRVEAGRAGSLRITEHMAGRHNDDLSRRINELAPTGRLRAIDGRS